MNLPQIRHATLADANTLVDFNRAMALETEGLHLIPELLALGVERVLTEPQRGFYLVSQCDQQVVGALLVTYEWSDWRNGNWWWIQSVYVRPDFRKQGIFRGLYQFVSQLAQQDTTVCGLRLYAERDNAAALATYTKLGMRMTHYSMLEQLKPGITYCQPG
jgi:GNAT superfamily N-acetyltransferase